MKKLIHIITGILLITLVTAGAMLVNNIKPEVSPEKVQKLIDCGYSAKYKLSDEICNGIACDIKITFNPTKKYPDGYTDWFPFTDRGGDIEKTIKQETEYYIELLIKQCEEPIEEKDKHGIPKDTIDLGGIIPKP